MIDREQGVQAIRASSLGDLADVLIPLLAPSVRIGIRPVRPDDLPLGASRLGGQPDLPASMDWPMCEDRPLALVAQIHLSDVAPLGVEPRLPEDGWLYFFFDTVSEAPFAQRTAGASWRVSHFPGRLGALRRVDPPSDHPRLVFPPCALGFAAQWTLPSFNSTRLTDAGIRPELRRDYEALVFSLLGPPPIPEPPLAGRLRHRWDLARHRWIGDPVHRMFGHPEHFEADPRLDWQQLADHHRVAVALDEQTREKARDWLLLLQVDKYRDGPDWQGGEHGTIYFGIRPEDLESGRFDQVQWTIECD